MPMYNKRDIYQVTEFANGTITITKKVAYCWHQCGKQPETYVAISDEEVAKHGLPAGKYYYVGTLETVVADTCPQNGVYANAIPHIP